MKARFLLQHSSALWKLHLVCAQKPRSCLHVEAYFSVYCNDMHSQEAIQALNEARSVSLREASEKRDVDALMSWHAKDAVFNDVGTEAEPLTQ